MNLDVAFLGEFERVVGQVDYQLLELGAVGVDGASLDVGGHVEPELDGGVLALAQHHLIEVAQVGGDVECREVEHYLAGLDARAVEQVADEREQRLRAFENQVDEFLAVALGARRVVEQLGKAHNAVHGRAYLVRESCEEVGLELVGALGAAQGLVELYGALGHLVLELHLALLQLDVLGGNHVAAAGELGVDFDDAAGLGLHLLLELDLLEEEHSRAADVEPRYRVENHQNDDDVEGRMLVEVYLLEHEDRARVLGNGNQIAVAGAHVEAVHAHADVREQERRRGARPLPFAAVDAPLHQVIERLAHVERAHEHLRRPDAARHQQRVVFEEELLVDQVVVDADLRVDVAV